MSSVAPPVTPQVASPAGSWRGWAFWKLVRENKTGLKAAAGALCAYLAQQVALISNPALNSLAASVVGLLSWGLLCAIDYWASAQVATPPSGSPTLNP